eukprot:c21240_g1_i1 orf=7-2145(-)
MVSCQSSSSLTIVDSALTLWKEWQITILMLLTMWLQVLLVVGGVLRRHTANGAVRLLVWFSYVGVDTVATYALGLMVGESCDIIFSLWAPILLFHLGAGDAISAWSAADNEMWQRQGLKMSLEVLAAVYILFKTLCFRYLVVGVLLFVVGAIKYAERISALRSGSRSQILKSARPLYDFMAVEHKVSDEHTHPLLVVGENEWYADHVKAMQSNSQEFVISTDEAVTYQEIRECKELKKVTGGYMSELCLAYALCKVFKRRLTNLRIHQKEEDYEKVRKLLTDLPPRKLIRVLDLELSFIFDGIFTKAAGSAYTQAGVFLRLLSAALLVVATVYVVIIDVLQLSCSDSSVRLAGVMTHVFLAVALVLEIVQICGMIRSNWTKVWLGCTYIKEKRRYRTMPWAPIHNLNSKAILCIIPFVGAPKNVHWKDEVGQVSILNSCLEDISHVYLANCKLKRLWEVKRMRRLLSHLSDVSCYDLELFLLEKLGALLKDMEPANFSDIKHRMTRIVGTILAQRAPEFSWASNSGLEHAIICWHIATTICEMSFWEVDNNRKGGSGSINYSNVEESRDIQMSIALSKYVMHLLRNCPKLLPGDPDTAKLLCRHTEQSLKLILVRHPKKMHNALLRDYKPSSKDPEALRNSPSDSGIVLGRQLLVKPVLERWHLLADIWCDILTLIAMSEDSMPHTQQLTKGGELVTHMWVLLGHIGFNKLS